eukprot:CAMPEP_0179098428 /NCGR_PEP_ID=MMETSP0796-20121207/45359_1 /TAXON_ID=73915 /ORGANISM="Pyrodinium bahamense, Strain pbaha01" /LENGTH=508 /DNA_ID=CAMNT_0020796207 /DNA_START=1 /DNA_END=1527 /DNA_ORIENTATION=+
MPFFMVGKIAGHDPVRCQQAEGARGPYSAALAFILLPVLTSGVEVTVLSSGALHREGGLAPDQGLQHFRTEGTQRHDQRASGAQDLLHTRGRGQRTFHSLFTEVSHVGVQAGTTWPNQSSTLAHASSYVGAFNVVNSLTRLPVVIPPTRHVAAKHPAQHTIDRGPDQRAIVRRASNTKHTYKDDSDLNSNALRIADGVGTMTYDSAPTDNRRLNSELRKRLVVQDCAAIVVLAVAFALSVLVSCLNVYHFSDDPSPVLYYSDPKNFRQRLVCASASRQAFLQAFNTQPQAARLRIIGKSGGSGGLMQDLRLGGFTDIARVHIRELLARTMLRARRSETLASLGRHGDTLLFDVALDLTPFITGEGRLSSEADAATLEEHFHTKNPLEVLVLTKRVEWDSWEDMATNIRQHLRTLGFPGAVEVRLEAREELLVYSNNRWQNFVRSRITHALVVLSIVGGIFWVPYLWLRTRTVRIESRFKICLDMERYWELLAEGLHASEGFQGRGLVR